MGSFSLYTSASLWLAKQAVRLHQRRRRVTVLVHRAYFLGDSAAVFGPDPHFFIKVTNLSREREVEITHIWVAPEGGDTLHLLNEARPLPARLRPDEQFETWAAVSAIPLHPDLEWQFRIQLSNGKVARSRPNCKVPAAGYVAGPGS